MLVWLKKRERETEGKKEETKIKIRKIKKCDGYKERFTDMRKKKMGCPACSKEVKKNSWKVEQK